MNETEIINQCLLSDESLMMHALYTDPETIRDPFVKNIYKIILSIYESNQAVDIMKVYYALPAQTRLKDVIKICGGMI